MVLLYLWLRFYFKYFGCAVNAIDYLFSKFGSFVFQDPKYKKFAQKLHQKWLSLGRKVAVDVRDSPSVYSLVYLDNPIIVPGGRFRECYYWDSYWTILGLLVSEMEETVKGR